MLCRALLGFGLREFSASGRERETKRGWERCRASPGVHDERGKEDARKALPQRRCHAGHVAAWLPEEEDKESGGYAGLGQKVSGPGGPRVSW